MKVANEEGVVTEDVKERTYDLKSKGKGRMIQVSIPAKVGDKKFEYNVEVELVNIVTDTVATATLQGANVDWYIKADDIKIIRREKTEQTEKINRKV